MRDKSNLVFVVLYLAMILCMLTKVNAQGKSDVYELYKEAKVHADAYPDSIYSLVEKYKLQFTSEKDTSMVIKSILLMADIKKNKGAFSKAYDHSWEALMLAEEAADTFQTANCHQLLGMLYGIFNSEELSIYHLQHSLELSKYLVNARQLEERKVLPPYFSMAVQYSRSGKYDMAEMYLDSCMSIALRNKYNTAYIQAEQANIAIKKDELVVAEKLLNEISPYFIDAHIHFEVMIYSFWGELQRKQHKLDEALASYEACLSAMKKNNTHTDIRPNVLQRIAEIYSLKGKDRVAMDYLQESKAVNDSLFSAQDNSELLEVKNTYRKAMQLKNEELEQQHILLEKKKQLNFRLKVVIGMILLVLVITVLVIRHSAVKRKFKASQNELELKAKLEKEKLEEVMEVKNKEITSYTLQLIDKEHVVDNLLDELKKIMDDKAFRRIRNATKETNKNLWNDFNARFSQVNTKFYERLLAEFPQLSPTDLKHCALIRLNFNGNEMAQLLNISLSSVHIARHRLRKKLGLKREDNLAMFIGKL